MKLIVVNEEGDFGGIMSIDSKMSLDIREVMIRFIFNKRLVIEDSKGHVIALLNPKGEPNVSY